MQSIDAGDRLHALIDAAELDAEHLDLWEAWKIFKAFVRETGEGVDDGVTVQVVAEDPAIAADRVVMSALRQFCESDSDEQTPVGYVGLEFTFAAAEMSMPEDVELWSFDYPTFADFASAVEVHPVFQRAVGVRPLNTEIVIGEI